MIIRKVAMEEKKQEQRFLMEICANCGLSFGAHSARGNNCPAHEDQMDWKQGPGTTFMSTGVFDILPSGTPAKNLPSQEKEEV